MTMPLKKQRNISPVYRQLFLLYRRHIWAEVVNMSHASSKSPFPFIRTCQYPGRFFFQRHYDILQVLVHIYRKILLDLFMIHVNFT